VFFFYRSKIYFWKNTSVQLKGNIIDGSMVFYP